MAYPVILDPLDLGDSPTGTYGFQVGSTLYRFQLDSNTTFGLTFGFGHAYKSTDLGLTWTLLDDGNAPQAKPVAGYPAWTATLDGTIVQFLWARKTALAAQGFTACIFDLNTETWGSPANIAAPTLDFTGGTRLCFQLCTRGPNDYILFYSSTRSAGSGRVSYSTFDGVTLGAGVVIPGQIAGHRYIVIGCVCETVSGITQLVYSDSSSQIRAVGLDSSNVLGTPALAASNDNFISFDASQPIVYDNAGTLEFAFAYYSVLFPVGNVRLIHSPILLDAIWSTSVALAGNDGTDDFLPFNNPAIYVPRCMALASVNGKIAIAWTIKQFNSTNKWAFAGVTADLATFTWSAVAVLFEATPGGLDVRSVQVSMFPIATAGMGLIAVGVDNNFPFEDTNQFFLFTAAPPNPPVIVANPPIPTAVNGVPYSYTPTTFGGTPPYTFTSSTLPTGLVIDPMTGEISGIPTDRTTQVFIVTVTVTDAALQSVSVTFSIVAFTNSRLRSNNFALTSVGKNWLDNTGASPINFPMRGRG